MKLNSYSQNGEDDFIWKYFQKKNQGLIIEVGAFDGIHLSNSYALEKIGWTSICIEPNPDYFPLLTKNRPDALCINAALVDTKDSGKFMSFYTEELGLLSGLNINSSEIKERYKKRGLSFKGIQKKEVQTISFNNLFEKYDINGSKIDCITIDVEGTELDVLKGLNFEIYHPKLLIIEGNDKKQTDAIKLYLHTKGFQYVFTIGSINHCFIPKTVSRNKIDNIQIDTNVVKTLHPLGKDYTLKLRKPQSIQKSFFNVLFVKIRSFFRVFFD